MGDVVILHSIPIDLNSTIGHQFVVDCTRAAEGLITDNDLQSKYELSPVDWRNITKDTAVMRAFQAERERRVLTGVPQERRHPDFLSKHRKSSAGS